jgi:hypothetical protein
MEMIVISGTQSEPIRSEVQILNLRFAWKLFDQTPLFSLFFAVPSVLKVRDCIKSPALDSRV